MHHDIPHGLQADWPQMQLLARRRQGLRLLGGLGLAGALPLLGCGGGSSSDAGTTGTTGTTGSTGSTGSTGTVTSCSAIPDETAGPYPGDGSNTANGSVANVLGLGDVVRSDIRSSFGGLSGTAAGVPLTVTLTLVNSGALCASLVGYAIYLWHCGTVALWPGWPVFNVLGRCHQPELPARCAGERCQRPGHLSDHCPGLLQRALAPHPF